MEPCTGEVHLRRATEKDATAIAEVHVETWRWAYRDILPAAFLDRLDRNRREEFWRREIETLPRERRPWIAEVVARVVGFVSAGPSRDEDADLQTGEIYAIYVRRECWDRGIGRHLLDHAVRDVWAWEYRVATLWVLAANARARDFYERSGWSLDGAERTERIGDTDVVEVRYRRSLVGPGAPSR
jgi:ribosomal protein S18 acetylase RimI-like enzyme